MLKTNPMALIPFVVEQDGRGERAYDIYSRLLKADIPTSGVGQAASMAAVILAAGTPGKRFSLPNSRIILHQPFGGYQGQAADVAIQAKEILRIRESLYDILHKHTL